MQPFRVIKDDIFFLKGQPFDFHLVSLGQITFYIHVFLLREKALSLEPRLGYTVWLCSCTFKQFCSYGSGTNTWGMKMLLKSAAFEF